MHLNLNLYKYLLPFSIPVLMIISLIALATSKAFHQYPNDLAFGITMDLVFSMPLVYLYLIRKKNIPKITAFPLFLLGILIAGWILPSEHQQVLHFIKQWIFPLAEVGMVSYLIYQVRTIRLGYKKQRQLIPDFFTALKQASIAVFPGKIAGIFAFEIAVIYYSLLNWKKISPADGQFTYHKRSGLSATIGLLIFIILLETAAVHLLFIRYSPTFAWVLFALSIYTALQLLALAKSASRRFITIRENKIFIPNGIFSETEIDIHQIAEIELSRKRPKVDKMTRKMSVLGDFEPHNTILQLHSPHTWHGLYGMKRKYKTLLIHLDDPQNFRKAIENRKNEDY